MGGSQSHFGDKRALALCTSKYCFSSDATKGGEYVSRITRPRLDFAAQNNKELETFNCLAETRAHFYIYVPFLLLLFFFLAMYYWTRYSGVCCLLKDGQSIQLSPQSFHKILFAPFIKKIIYFNENKAPGINFFKILKERFGDVMLDDALNSNFIFAYGCKSKLYLSFEPEHLVNFTWIYWLNFCLFR